MLSPINKISSIGLLIVSLSSVGCSSNRSNTPQPFDIDKSHALNIATQSSLLDGGGLLPRSPLRDFTKEEVEEVSINLRRNYSSMNKVIGAVSILFGNFSGIIDVASGYAMDFGNANHQAADPRWLIVIDKNKFGNSEEALGYANKVVLDQILILLNKYGAVKEKFNKDKSINYYEITVNGNATPVGMGGFTNRKPIVESRLFYKDAKSTPQDSWLIGFDNEYQSSFYNVPVVTAANSEIKDLDIDEEEFYKELTSNLPDGFYFYVPAFPRYSDGNTHYTDLSAVVPSIYHRGVKHSFIKP